MRTIFLFLTRFLVTKSPAAPVIYSLKFLVFHFLGLDFLTFSIGHRCENQHVLGLGV